MKLCQMQLTAGSWDRRRCFDVRAKKKTSMEVEFRLSFRLCIIYQAVWARRAQRCCGKHCCESCQNNWSTRAAEKFKSPFDANAELQTGLEVWLPCFCSLRSKIDIFRALNKTLQGGQLVPRLYVHIQAFSMKIKAIFCVCNLKKKSNSLGFTSICQGQRSTPGC